MIHNHHVISYDRSGASSQRPGHGSLYSSSTFLYLADALHKAAGNTPLLASATWEIEHHKKHLREKKLSTKYISQSHNRNIKTSGIPGALRPGRGQFLRRCVRSAQKGAIPPVLTSHLSQHTGISQGLNRAACVMRPQGPALCNWHCHAGAMRARATKNETAGPSHLRPCPGRSAAAVF